METKTKNAAPWFLRSGYRGVGAGEEMPQTPAQDRQTTELTLAWLEAVLLLDEILQGAERSNDQLRSAAAEDLRAIVRAALVHAETMGLRGSHVMTGLASIDIGERHSDRVDHLIDRFVETARTLARVPIRDPQAEIRAMRARMRRLTAR